MQMQYALYRCVVLFCLLVGLFCRFFLQSTVRNKIQVKPIVVVIMTLFLTRKLAFCSTSSLTISIEEQFFL